MALTVDEARAALAEGDEPIRHAAVTKLDLAAPGALALLVQAMGDDAWRVRRQAVERATQSTLAPHLFVDVLVPLLGEPENVGLRNAAVEAVVGLERAAVAAVEAALVPRPEHRKVLCDVLGRIGSPDSAAALAPLLDDEDSNVRIAAAEALGRLPAPPRDQQDAGIGASLGTHLSAIAAAPPDSSTDLLMSALVEAMGKRGAVLPTATLAQLLPNPVVGIAALRALGSGSAPTDLAARGALRTLVLPELGAGPRVRREAALLALAAILPELSEDDLDLSPAVRASATEALLEATVEVQRAAAAVLAASGRADVARPLLVAASDAALADAVEQALVRVAARDLHGLLALASSTLGEARAAAYRVLTQVLPRVSAHDAEVVLGTLIKDADAAEADVAVAALAAIGAVGRAEGALALAAAIERAYAQRDELESAWDRIDAAQRGLALLAERARPAVLEVLRARTQVPPFSLLLGRIGDASDVHSLVDQLRAPDGDVRRAAAEAVAELVSRDNVRLDAGQLTHVSDAARELLVDELAAVRAAAVRALAASEVRAHHVGQGAVEGLLRAARDEDVRVRGAAARALVQLTVQVGGDLAATLLGGLRQLADGRDPLTSVPALEALLQARDTTDDARLIDALTGSDEERRKVGLHALAMRPQLLVRGDLLRLVERALHDTRWDLRRAAIAALGAVGDAGRSALVTRRTIETDPLVRADLDRALGRPADAAKGAASSKDTTRA